MEHLRYSPSTKFGLYRISIFFFTIFFMLCSAGIYDESAANPLNDESLISFRILTDSPYRIGPYRPPALNLGLGPFNIRQQSPNQSLRLTPLYFPPETIGQGKVKLFMGATWSNIWSRERDYLFDFEMLDTHLEFNYGLTDRFNLTAAITHRNYFGGVLDGFIKGFQSLFGISHKGRDQASKNEFKIEFYDEEGSVTKRIDKDNANLESTAVIFAAQAILFQGSATLPAIAVAGNISYGLDSPPSHDSNDPVDYGVGIGLTQEWLKDWHTYHYWGITRYGQTELLGIEFEKKAFYTMNALIKHNGHHGSVILQHMYHEGTVKDIDKLSKGSHEIILGFKYRLAGGSLLQLALIENTMTFDKSPDFGINIGYSYSW